MARRRAQCRQPHGQQTRRPMPLGRRRCLDAEAAGRRGSRRHKLTGDINIGKPQRGRHHQREATSRRRRGRWRRRRKQCTRVSPVVGFNGPCFCWAETHRLGRWTVPYSRLPREVESTSVTTRRRITVKIYFTR